MNPFPSIVEVIGRSSQGITRPFICRADDHNIYYVKGRYAGARSLVNEWLAGSLARAFGLPIVPFTQLHVPEALLEVQYAHGEPLSDLGEGVVFGSLRQSFAEVTPTTANRLPASLKADIAVFDFWIRNEDRTLSELGGNPNLFWDAGSEKPWLLDHNLAFDQTFNKFTFLSNHIFARQWLEVASDFVSRQTYAERLSAALSVWTPAKDAMPDLWHYLDAEKTVPHVFEFDAIFARLQDCQGNQFWDS
jgi:hypothetical protein